MAVRDRASAREAFKVLRTDELFEKTSPDSSREVPPTMMLSLTDLYPFKDHPFKMYNEEKMEGMVKSIEQNGVNTPIIVRPHKGGDGYEIISGHNRVEASKRAMLSEIRAIVCDVDDDTAINIMVDSNIYERDEKLPTIA